MAPRPSSMAPRKGACEAADNGAVEANNGYEYRVVKVRSALWRRHKAAQRAIARAASEGWEVVSTSTIEGVAPIPIVTLRRTTSR